MDNLNSLSRFEKRGDFRIWYRDPVKVVPVLKDLLPDPDSVINHSGEPYRSAWIASPTAKGRIRIASEDYFYKRYPGLGLLYGFKNMFRPSKALHAFRLDQLIRQAGIPTFSPVVCLERRHAGFLKESYLLFPFAKHSENLLTLWPLLDTGRRRDCLDQIATVIGRMHWCGILHGDLNWRNVLVEKQGNDVALIDFDGGQKASVSRERGLLDLKHFFRDMERNNLGLGERERFVLRWENALIQGDKG